MGISCPTGAPCARDSGESLGCGGLEVSRHGKIGLCCGGEGGKGGKGRRRWGLVTGDKIASLPLKRGDNDELGETFGLRGDGAPSFHVDGGAWLGGKSLTESSREARLSSE